MQEACGQHDQTTGLGNTSAKTCPPASSSPPHHASPRRSPTSAGGRSEPCRARGESQARLITKYT
eukprot:5016025-Alexandrium_andersonii.AAC.1